MTTRTQMRVGGSVTCLLVGAAIVAMGLTACASTPGGPAGGTCCTFTGPVAYDCASIENLGPGADLDGSGCIDLADLATLLANYGVGT